MTLLFVDGFDHYATADVLKKWTSLDGTPSINATAGRRGGGALELAALEYVAKTAVATNVTTLIVGMAYDLGGGSNGDILLFRDATSSVTHVGIRINGALGITAYRGSTSSPILSSANAVVPANGWFYIETKVTVHDTTGSVEVYINGVSVLNATNVDTRNGTSSSLSGFRVYGVSGLSCKVDDLYACDVGGTYNNTFLGDCRVDTVFPTGDGTYAQWTPSTGSSHFALVDETVPNTTDYVASGGVGLRDSYTLADLPALGAQGVFGIQVNAAALKDDSGFRTMSTMVRSGTDDVDGAAVALSTSQTYVSQVYERTFSGSAWTETLLNGLEAGVKVTG